MCIYEEVLLPLFSFQLSPLFRFNIMLFTFLLLSPLFALFMFCCCRCSWSRPEDRAWGTLQPDGTWNGMVGDLIADKGDVIVAIGRTLPREMVVDFTLPLLLDRCDS